MATNSQPRSSARSAKKTLSTPVSQPGTAQPTGLSITELEQVQKQALKALDTKSLKAYVCFLRGERNKYRDLYEQAKTKATRFERKLKDAQFACRKFREKQEPGLDVSAVILGRLKAANAEFAAKGGCPGCGSQILGVHGFPCSESDKHPFD